MLTKKVLKYYFLGLTLLLASFGIGFVVIVNALAYTEKSEVLLTTSLKIGGREQKFKAFYLSAPADGFEIKFNVSRGSIKFSPWPASIFEESLGYFEYNNGTTVEKRQVWFFEGNNGTAGCCGNDVNQVWYIHFYNEDAYEKEVQIQVIKVWKVPNYLIWIKG